MELAADHDGTGPLPAAHTGEAETPRTLGRYVILETLHRSAAAEVFAAYDPELDRKVAIKLLAVEPRLGLLPELAPRGHPHLITVHDVGTFGQRVFIAMEFAHEGSLTAWLTQGAHPQPWPEILRRFLDAGAGLVAAHAQGLAHLGFAADAVLLGADGRARVMGFYRPADPAAQALAMRNDGHAFIQALRCALCQAPGTAMAPAQWLAGVPARVRRLLQQPAIALSQGRPRPGDELAALLRALHPRARRPRFVAILVLALGGVLAGALHYQKQAALCRGADALLAPLSDQGRTQAIHRAFLQTGKPYAEEAFVGVQRSLATYLPRWASSYKQACEDTRQRRQPEAVRDLRMACLEQQRVRLDHLFTVFTTADEQVVQRAVALVHELAVPSSLQSCSDVAGLRAQAAPPADLATAAAVTAIRQDLARSEALHHAGRYQDELRLVALTTARAAKLPYRPIHAETLLQEGRCRSVLGEHAAAELLLRRAVWAAEASHHDRVAAQAWLHLFFVAAEQLQRIGEAREYARHAAAAIQRCTGCADLWEQWHDSMGELRYAEGRPAEALVHFQQTLAQRQQRLPPTSLELAHSYNNLGIAYAAMEQPAASIEQKQRALRIAEHELGPWHPAVASGLRNIAMSQQDLGQLAEALRNSERALQIYQQAFGKAHSSVAITLSAMGAILVDMGRYRQAQEHLEQALAIVESDLEHPRFAYILNDLGEVALHLHRPDQARARFEAAIAIRTATLPPQHLDHVFSLVGLSRALIALDRVEQAEPLVLRALRICAANPPNAETLAGAQFALAMVRWHLRTTRGEARQLAAEARAAYTTLGDGFRGERTAVEQWLRGHPLPR